MLIDEFDMPHVIGVDSPTYTRSAVTNGNLIEWDPVAEDVPCQLTAAGGNVSEVFGGDKFADQVTISLARDVIEQGYRIRFSPTEAPSIVANYIVKGGNSRIEAIGGITQFFTWTCELETGTTGESGDG